MRNAMNQKAWIARAPKQPLVLETVDLTSEKFTEGAANELDEELALHYGKITITHVPSGKTFSFDTSSGKAF